MVKERLIVGIDPDVTASGVAELNAYSLHCEATSLPLSKLISRLIYLSALNKSSDTEIVVVVEAGWLNKGNWHITSTDNKAQACAKGYHVGRNHQIGISICEIAEYLGFRVVKQRPLRKFWRGANKKITAKELEQLTGLHGKTTQDARDAVLLAWNYAGLPLRLPK